MKNIRKKYRLREYINEQTGAASIVEYSIVLPLCLVVVMFLFLLAYFLNERAVLDAAAHRSVLVAEKLYFDPKFKQLADLDYAAMEKDYVGYKKQFESLENQEIRTEPYRFFLGNSEFKEYAEKCVEQKAISCVRNNQLFPLGDRVQNLKVEKSEISYGLVKKVVVTITEEYHMPRLVTLIGLEQEYKMQVSATTSLSAEPELIRNIDLAMEVAEDTGVDKYLEKAKKVFSKIGNFVKSLGEEKTE